jgi:galactokinase
MPSQPLPSAKPFIVSAPGRVNLLGEHVDYNDGPVLPVAIDREVKIAANPRARPAGHQIRLDLNQSVTFHLDQLERKK